MDTWDWVVAALLVIGAGLEAWAILYIVKEWPSLWGPFQRRRNQTIKVGAAASVATAGSLAIRVDRAPAEGTEARIERLEQLFADERQERERQDEAIRSDMGAMEGRVRDHVETTTSSVASRLEGVITLDKDRGKRAATLIIAGIIVGAVANLVGLAA